MKKILFAVLAIIMTLSVSAQSQAKCCTKVGAKQQKVVYSAETRAMMRVDRIDSMVEGLKKSERKALVKFFTDKIAKMDENRAKGVEVDKKAYRKECNDKVKSVLGEERYAKYTEARKQQRIERQKMHAKKECNEIEGKKCSQTLSEATRPSCCEKK